MKFTLVGPEMSPYAGKKVRCTFFLTADYPRNCPSLYVDDDLYHVNVNSKTNKVLFKRLLPKNWFDGIRLLQLTIEFLRVLRQPESINYFPSVPGNKERYNQFKDDTGNYIKIAEM